MGLLEDPRIEVAAPPRATEEELSRFHEPGYLALLAKASAGEFDPAILSAGLGTPDNPVFPGLYEYGSLACGASLAGARRILAGTARIAFNPSGGYHHARAGMAAGFCYLNDLVLACLAFADAGKRVLYLDLDAHHGDGVQEAFYARPDVFTISLHESGETLYPGTGFEHEIGEGPGRGYTANLPLPVGTYDEVYLRAFESVVLPLAQAYRPDALVVQLGMDTLAGDPLAHLHLTNNVFVDVIEELLALGIPILATGGGGYHVENTARGWALAWSVLSGSRPAEDLSIGLGGVMLQSTDWLGGLRDRALLAHGGRRSAVDTAVESSVEKLRAILFPRHGIQQR
jgi:acetoin utilization protein AcuC